MKKEYPDILKLEGEKWQNPDPATGKLGTRVPAEWLQTTEDSLKSLTLEMLEVLKAAGINPNELNNTQVRDAIQKMILARVINYNDIQGRPVVKDSLGDDRNNPASQRVVNDVNRAAKNAQTSANNANNKANAAQSRADSAYNLAQTKQDKLTFVGDGPDVMKNGAFGLGISNVKTKKLSEIRENGIYRIDGSDEHNPSNQGASYISCSISGVFRQGILIESIGNPDSYSVINRDGKISISKHLTDKNTTFDKSGFLRASGSKDAVTTDQITSTLSDRTDRVSTIKAVNDIANQMIGVAQKWVDVTAQRAVLSSYTNNTKKPILVSISGFDDRGNPVQAIVNGVVVGVFTRIKPAVATTVSFIVPPGENYEIRDFNFKNWSELR